MSLPEEEAVSSCLLSASPSASPVSRSMRKAVAVLQSRGIKVVSVEHSAEHNDFAIRVLDFTFSGTQLISLMNRGELSEEGIRRFAAFWKLEEKKR